MHIAQVIAAWASLATIANAIATFPYSGATYSVPGGTDFTIDPGQYIVEEIDNTSLIELVDDTLHVRKVTITPSLMMTALKRTAVMAHDMGVMFTVNGTCVIRPTGAILCDEGQIVVLAITGYDTDTFTVAMHSPGTLYANGNIRVHNGLTTVTSEATGRTFGSTTENVFVRDERNMYSAPGQAVGAFALEAFESAVYAFASGTTTVAGLSALSVPATGMGLDLGSPYTGAIVDGAFGLATALTVSAPAGTFGTASNPAYPFPPAEIAFPLEVQWTAFNASQASVSLEMVAEEAMTIAQSQFMTMSLTGQIGCTVFSSGVISCVQPPAGTRISLEQSGSTVSLSDVQTPFSFVGDGTTNIPGTALMAVDNLLIIIFMSFLQLLLYIIIFFILARIRLASSDVSVSVSESSRIALFALRVDSSPVSVGSLNTSTLVYTVPANMALTNDATGVLVEAVNGGTIHNGVVTLAAGAQLPLDGSLAAYSFELAGGLWDAVSGCYSMAADSAFAVILNATNAVLATAAFIAPTTVCPTGTIRNTATGRVIASVDGSGDIVRAPDVPPECRSRAVSAAILLQRGGFDNALATCADYGLAAMDVTAGNIAGATELLATCGGLVKSVYVGSFDGTSNGCLALYTGSTPGAGTVAAAPCVSNTPVMCHWAA